MKRRRADSANVSRVAQISALLVAGALGLAVFYYGPQFALLAGAQFLLVTWIALSLACCYEDGVRLPFTPVSLSLTLFWLWLGISLLWTAVPVTSIINFWWVGSLALAFWAYTLSPQRERIWFYLARFALIGALALCGYALVQLFVWHEPPRSTFVNIHSFAALMMLVALSLGGYFLIAWHNHSTRRTLCILGACLFALYFTIATTEGRGTTLSIVLSMIAFAILTSRLVGRRPVLVLVGVVVAAYGVANLVLHGGLIDRAATLADPGSAAAPRLLIWRGSWALLMQHPWWGIGLGTYYLAWPPFRDPADDTLGFFVHNDYLQLWIEAGLPALLLLLAVFVSVLWMLLRLLRSPNATVALQIEALGLCAGLVAVAAHSFVDFNLYILSISIAAGLALGRFHECVGEAVPARARTMRPSSVLRSRVYTVTVILVALFPLSYFVALGLSDYFYKRGFELAAAGELPQADDAFTWAERLLPGDDKVLIMHADLYRHVLKRLPQNDLAERRSLYEAGMALLDEAQSENPYRALVHVVRGRVFQENQGITGSDWRRLTESEYAKALVLNPRLYIARAEYANLLLGAGREQQAYRVLTAGIDDWYYPSDSVLAYYRLTAEVAKSLGDGTRAQEIARKFDAMRSRIAAMAPLRAVVSEPVSAPAVTSSR
jgi:O-antigen ligase